ELEFRGLIAKWSMKDDEVWKDIYALLLSAPGKGAITLLQQMIENRKDTLHRVYGALAKVDSDDEAEKRERAAIARFDVISRLIEVGRPVPLWLSDDWRLLEGEVSGEDR